MVWYYFCVLHFFHKKKTHLQLPIAKKKEFKNEQKCDIGNLAGYGKMYRYIIINVFFSIKSLQKKESNISINFIAKNKKTKKMYTGYTLMFLFCDSCTYYTGSVKIFISFRVNMDWRRSRKNISSTNLYSCWSIYDLPAFFLFCFLFAKIKSRDF